MMRHFRIFLPAALAGLALWPITAAAAPWTVEDAKDPVTDQRSVLASLVGDGGTLQVGCSDVAKGKVSIYLIAPKGVYYGNGLRNLTYRVDAAAAQTDQWFYGADIATAAPYSEADTKIGAMVDAVVSGSTIILRTTDYRGNLRDSVFQLPADHAAVDRARTVCRAAALPH